MSQTYQETGPHEASEWRRVPRWLREQGVSDMGMRKPHCRCLERGLPVPCERSCDELLWEHRVDVQRGHVAAERYLLAHGYRPGAGLTGRAAWRDGEGRLWDRWVWLMPATTRKGVQRCRWALQRAKRAASVR